MYVINNNLTGIHKKFPHILTWKTLQGFTSDVSFADFIEEFNSELISSIEQSAKNAGIFIYIITLSL